jgi:SAM-dependent methyltransferase
MVGCVNAAKRGVSTVVNATLDALKIAPDSIAGTSMFDVIEHLPDPVGLLRDCREALRPGGRVYVTVPAYQALWSEEDVIAGHFRRYTRSMINQQFTDAGLRTEYVSHFFRPLVAPIFLMRAVPYRVLPKRDKSGSDLSQHGPGGTGQQVVERLLARELSDLKKGRALPYGGSIIAVATKP